jgi:hypothetical protein
VNLKRKTGFVRTLIAALHDRVMNEWTSWHILRSKILVDLYNLVTLFL